MKEIIVTTCSIITESEPYTEGDPDVPIETKADGFWQERQKPFEQFKPDPGSLPHMITVARQADETEFVFVVSGMRYASRRAGTAVENPSFFKDFSPITGINYYKNRLFFFTRNGNVVSSRAGKINNLFINSALSLSNIDPIDVTANSNQRVAIYDSAVVNNSGIVW